MQGKKRSTTGDDKEDGWEVHSHCKQHMALTLHCRMSVVSEADEWYILSVDERKYQKPTGWSPYS